MTQSAKWYLDISEKIFAGMAAHSNTVLEQYLEENGVQEGRESLFVQLAYGFAPEPITPEHITKRTPYANPKALKQQLKESAERGWLEAVGEHQYTITAKGKEVVEDFFALGRRVFGKLEPLPPAELKRTIALLRKVVDKAKAMPEPAEKWGLSWGSRFEPEPTAPLMTQLRRPMIDLSAYREDAHNAAWQPYDVPGHTWEALTYIWRGQASNAAELAEAVSAYRNYDEATYAAALHDLVDRGWIAEADGKYVATEKGKSLRQEAEDTTDRYYDAAWATLDEAETAEIKGLLERMAEALAPPEEEAAEG